MNFNMVTLMVLVLIVCLVVAFVLFLIHCFTETRQKSTQDDVETARIRHLGDPEFESNDRRLHAAPQPDGSSSTLLASAPHPDSDSSDCETTSGPPTYHTAVAAVLARQLRASIRKYSENLNEEKKLLDRVQQSLSGSAECDLAPR